MNSGSALQGYDSRKQAFACCFDVSFFCFKGGEDMKRIYKAQIDSENQIKLPAQLLQHLNMRDGEIVQIIDARDAIIVIKKEALEKYFKEN